MKFCKRIQGDTPMTTSTEMTMNTVAANTFAWNEIATRDTKTVSEFYCLLFGWTAELADCTEGYTLFKMGDTPICGMIEMNEEWPEDIPTHWGAYIYVEDVDATAAKVEAAGGTLCCGPMDAGEGGRMAVLKDPSGAVISLYKGGDGMNAVGDSAFCWNELLSTDTSASAEFYSTVFGWMPMAMEGTGEPYTLFMSGEDCAGSMIQMHWEGEQSWMAYVQVDDVDAVAAKATELGASLCAEPQDIPTVGRFAVFTDPSGATVGVFKSSTPCCGDSCGCS
jgi:predicted enzyme related to lactoylglutathione lyase